MRFIFESYLLLGDRFTSINYARNLLIPSFAETYGALKLTLWHASQMKASFYASYRTHLASWGYVVLQYDIPLLKYLQDTVEVHFTPLFNSAHACSWSRLNKVWMPGAASLLGRAVG